MKHKFTCKTHNCKSLEDNIGENLWDLGFGVEFLRLMIPKA